MNKNSIGDKLLHVSRGIGVIYIALIGIFAIEELQRRETLLALITARESQVAATVAILSEPRGDEATLHRASQIDEQTTLQGARARLTALIIGGAIQPVAGPPGTLKAILCELTAIQNVAIKCGAPEQKWSLREISASLVLKRACEQRASGDVFAVLVIVAAVGGALIRLYLPGADERDAFRAVFRAIGGGVVCYLCIRSGSLPFANSGVPTLVSPATGALLGLIAGMFSTRVFKLLSDIVDAWADKLAPARNVPGAADADHAAAATSAIPEEASRTPVVVTFDAGATLPATRGDGLASGPRENANG